MNKRRLLALLLAPVLAVVARAAPQDGGGGAPRTIEGFPQADAAQRALPPLVKWQRSLKDALVLQKRTGKPLLICVNKDGDPAADSLAWLRYRDPAFAALTDGFVCLIASPDRHTPIDYDDRGRRMTDPRFGRVVDHEHIDIEPVLFERYFEGQRIAPRHIGIAPDGTRLFDLFLLQRTLEPIDDALREHGKPDAPSGRAQGGAEVDLIDSPDAADRTALERRFVEGDWRRRFELASVALDPKRSTQQPELIRMALRDPDGRVVRQALWTVVRVPGELEADLVGEAFRASRPYPVLRDALTGAFGRLALRTEDDAVRVRARKCFLAFEGLAQDSAVVELDGWRAALEGAADYTPPTLASEDLDPLTEEVTRLEAKVAAAPDDVGLRLRQAEDLMRMARILVALGQDPSIALDEARVAASAAEAAGDDSGVGAGVLCWIDFQQGDVSGAATAGARALPALVEQAGSDLALQVLHVFAQARTRQVYDAVGADSDFEPGWVADARGAYEALLAHPGGTDQQVVELLNLLGTLDARAEQDDLARRAVVRFPFSADLHTWLRFVLLRDQGADALETAYADLRSPEGGEAMHAWYAGLASLMAAERQVGNRDPQAAHEAYERCIERMRASMDAESSYADSALHYVCLARAGEARLDAEAERWDDAIVALREGLTGRPASAETADGLGHTPAATARLVLRGLADAGLDDKAQQLRDALDAAGIDLRLRRRGE